MTGLRVTKTTHGRTSIGLQKSLGLGRWKGVTATSLPIQKLFAIQRGNWLQIPARLDSWSIRFLLCRTTKETAQYVPVTSLLFWSFLKDSKKEDSILWGIGFWDFPIGNHSPPSTKKTGYRWYSRFSMAEICLALMKCDCKKARLGKSFRSSSISKSMLASEKIENGDSNFCFMFIYAKLGYSIHRRSVFHHNKRVIRMTTLRVLMLYAITQRLFLHILWIYKPKPVQVGFPLSNHRIVGKWCHQNRTVCSSHGKAIAFWNDVQENKVKHFFNWDIIKWKTDSEWCHAVVRNI